MLYQMNFTSGKLAPIETESKNDLPVGTILELNGYNNPRFVIIENLGVKDPGYGARYCCVNLETHGIDMKDSHMLKFIADKKDNRIQTYISDGSIMDPSEVKDLHLKATRKETKRKDKAIIDAQKAEAISEKGKVWFDTHRPSWAKAVIVGSKETDDCDMMTDYFNTKSGAPHLLAWSKHTRDIFSEMRKAAANLEETKHLATAPNTDSNGDPKTDNNKSWWSPSDEHREKYSMGAGYYLKAANRYSTGWKVEKWPLGKWRLSQIYTAAGEGRIHI